MIVKKTIVLSLIKSTKKALEIKNVIFPSIPLTTESLEYNLHAKNLHFMHLTQCVD